MPGPARRALGLVSAAASQGWQADCHSANRQRGFDQGEIGLQDLAEISHSTSTGALQKALTGRTKKKKGGGGKGAKPLVTKHEG